MAAEFAVAVICCINASRYFDMKAVFKCYYQYWLAAAGIPVVCLLLDQCNCNSILLMVLKVVLSVTVYFACLLFLKNPFLRMAMHAAAAKMQRSS